jgi:SnoaL-like domain
MKTRLATTRRRFFAKVGAALSAPIAVATAAPSDDADALDERLGLLEDLDAIRELNRLYAKHVNAGERREVRALFADPARAAVDASIGGLADRFEAHDIEIAADRASATARIRCSVEIATPIEPSCPLVEMARAQGGGVARRAEPGVLEVDYVKRGAVWRIKRSTYRPE